jgi:prepilin-type processing-associated H-X9-DG protein/prepilin-type N-terminal cleavage/methylation domain-containing protein
MNSRPLSATAPGEASLPHPRFAGFSLLEVLVVVAVLMVLTTLYWGSNSAGRQRQLQNACKSNLQKIHIALQIYATEHSGKFPAKPGASTSAKALDVLVPKYTSDTSVFVCPGTGETEPPAGAPIANRRISYAYYMGLSASDSLPLMSDAQVNTKAKAAGEDLFSTSGKPPGNNHKTLGGNVLFCDGHVERSAARAAFPLPAGNGIVLLNP